MRGKPLPGSPLTRRTLLKTAGGLLGAAAVPDALSYGATARVRPDGSSSQVIDRLTGYMGAAAARDLPAEVIERTKHHILDTFAAMVSGSTLPPGRIALAFARAIGEYGSVVFISGNMPMKTEIVPLLIITKLEQYDYAGATAVALVMLLVSFALLLTINLLQWAARRRMAV